MENHPLAECGDHRRLCKICFESSSGYENINARTQRHDGLLPATCTFRDKKKFVCSKCGRKELEDHAIVCPAKPLLCQWYQERIDRHEVDVRLATLQLAVCLCLCCPVIISCMVSTRNTSKALIVKMLVQQVVEFSC